MLYVICEEQCKERDVSPEEFGKMMAGTLYGDAIKVLMEEIGNFIPDPVRKTMFQSLLSLADGGQSAALLEASQILAEKATALRAKTTQMLNDQIDPVWTKAMEDLEKAVVESGTTSASKSAAGLG
jgi:hypothetical protein